MGISYNELEEIKEIKHNLVKDLIEVGKQNGKLNEIDTLAHAIKNLCKVVETEEMAMEGQNMYSGARYSMNPYYSMMPPYAYDYSNARGRGANASRDSMGRYSSHEPNDYISSLYMAMNNAQSDMERQSIQNLINKAQQNM